MLFGGVSVALVLILAFLLRDTPPACGAAAGALSFKDALLALFAKPSAILMTFAFGLSNFGDIGFRIWMPTFLQRTFADLSPASAAFHAVIWFYAGGFLGILVGSRISDVWKRRGNIGARLDCNMAGLVLCAPCVFAVANISQSLCATGLALAAYGFVHGFYDANFIASFYEVVTPRYRTAAYGLFACGAFVIGSFAPAVIGFIGGAFSLGKAFSMLGIFYLGAAAVTLVARAAFLTRDYERE